MIDHTSDTTLSPKDLAKTIALMRAIGVDLQKYEVKSMKRELTKDIGKTLSAFSNGSGGYIICGLSEKDGFTPVDGFDPQAIQDSLAHACNESMQPPVRPDIDVLLYEGHPVVVASIPAMRPSDKPCYNTMPRVGQMLRQDDPLALAVALCERGGSDLDR